MNEEIKIGSRVRDEDGVTGTVTEIEDWHNVYVEYDNNKGSGFYCLFPDCDTYDPLFLIEEKNNGKKK